MFADEKAETLVASYSVGEKASVRVYETEPGLLEEVEVGQPDLSRAAEPAGLSMLERYEYYT
ncbi:MAG: hypothetical protein RLZZ450_7633, partial [Pseudomonadota bacterium]